jgi:hypothetical protein
MCSQPKIILKAPAVLHCVLLCRLHTRLGIVQLLAQLVTLFAAHLAGYT